MLYWAIVCLIVAVIAGVLGFGGIAGVGASGSFGLLTNLACEPAELRNCGRLRSRLIIAIETQCM